MNKKWEYYKPNKDELDRIVNKFELSDLLATVLLNRGIKTDEQIQMFLKPDRNSFYDPFEILDMEKAVNRIIKAMQNQEKVIIYGDYDADGITSITVLKKFLEEHGLKTDYYIPNRLEEGYGLNSEATREIIEKKYSLIITVDCGISGMEEIDLANKAGIETIITDHHEPLEELPKAYAIINPKVKGNKYPFRELAGVGVVFKLIQAISIKLKLKQEEYLKYLDIVCIGTISDIVPLQNENRVIAKLGLKLLAKTKNIGLQELIKKTGYKVIDSSSIAFGIAPRINACGRMGHQEEAIKLFLTNDLNEAKEITEKLSTYNSERQETEKKIFHQAIQQIEEQDINKLNTIVLGNDNWHHGIIGIVASKIIEKYYKPTVLVCFEGNEGKGSGRSIPGFDLHGALLQTSQYLEKFGGHEMAVGLNINKSNFEEFKQKFEKIAEDSNTEELVPVIKIDSEITKQNFKKELIKQLEELEPFGESNRQPIFVYKNLKIHSIRALTDGKHLKLVLRDDNLLIHAIGFNLGYLVEEYMIDDKVDVVGFLELNSYNGVEGIQINIKDIRREV